MSAKDEKIVDNSPVFIGHSRGASTYGRFFIIAVQTPGSGIFILLAVGIPSTGSGNLYCQWELSPGSGNALCILFPTVNSIVQGDLQVLFDSHKGGKGSCVWQHQDLWEIKSWRLYTISNVPCFGNCFCRGVVGNDMTTAEQLIHFIKNQLAAAQVFSV
nr:hypothetical protein [Tanacetum cinerariifolium]